MPADKETITLATRGSDLALAQTHQVEAALLRAMPHLRVEIAIIKTTGDNRLDLSLSATGAGKVEKGLFTKELEEALLERRADLAVHSLKDLPTQLPPGLQLSAVLERAPTADVLVLAQRHRPSAIHSLDGLPPQSAIATSSLRRAALLRHHRADVQIHEIRGNVPTRLRKLAESEILDGMILAEAGLRRLGYGLEGGQLFDPHLEVVAPAVVLPLEQFPPAVGQGAIALESRGDDPEIEAILARINHQPTWLQIRAERELLRALGGGCQTPLGVHSEPGQPVSGQISLRAIMFTGPDNTEVVQAESSGSSEAPELIGRDLARLLQGTAC